MKPYRPKKWCLGMAKRGLNRGRGRPIRCHQGDIRPRQARRSIGRESQLGGLLSGRSPMPNGLNLAHARLLKQAQTVARNLLGILEALPLVIDLQAGPLIRVHNTDIGSLEVAIGRRLWCEQRRVGSVDAQFSISAWFSVLMGTRGSCLDLRLNRI
jgi:hypothetical protein